MVVFFFFFGYNGSSFILVVRLYMLGFFWYNIMVGFILIYNGLSLSNIMVAYIIFLFFWFIIYLSFIFFGMIQCCTTSYDLYFM